MDFLEATDVEALEEEMALAALVNAAASGGEAAADLEKRTATELAAGGGGGEVAELETRGQTRRETGFLEAPTRTSEDLEVEIPGRGGEGEGGAGSLTKESAERHSERSRAAAKHNGISSYDAGFPSGLTLDTRSLSACPSGGLEVLKQGVGNCVTCGKVGDGRMLHRLKQHGLLQHHCSSCILFYNKGMYCSVCFQVFSDCNQLGDPALWLTCCKCQRLSHLECVRNHRSPSSSSDFASFTCSDCSSNNRKTQTSMKQATMEVNSNMEILCCASSVDANEPPRMCVEPPNKKLRMNCEAEVKTRGADDTGSGHTEICTPKQSRLDHVDQETLAAAKIVAALTAKEAVVAKAKAVATAAVAVKAAARAKAALDAAYWAGKEEAKFKAHASRHLAVMSGDVPSLQGFDASMMTMRKTETGETKVGRNGNSSELRQTLARVDEHARHPQEASNGFYKNSSVGAAAHKRRKLSAVAASEASRAGDSDVAIRETVAPAKQQTLQELTCVQAAHHGSATPVHDVAEHSDDGLQRHVVALACSEGLLTGALQTSTSDSDEVKHHGGLSPVHEVDEHIHEKLKQHILSVSGSEALQTGSFQLDIPSAEQTFKDLGQHVYFLADPEVFLTGNLQTSTPCSEEDLHHGTLNSVYEVAEQSRA